MRVVNFTTIVIRIKIFSKVIKIGIIENMPDITKSNRKAIALRCPKGGRGGVSPPQGLKRRRSRVLGAEPLASLE